MAEVENFRQFSTIVIIKVFLRLDWSVGEYHWLRNQIRLLEFHYQRRIERISTE